MKTLTNMKGFSLIVLVLNILRQCFETSFCQGSLTTSITINKIRIRKETLSPNL